MRMKALVVLSLVLALGVPNIAAQVRQDRALIQPPAGTVQLYCQGGMTNISFEMLGLGPGLARSIVGFNKASRPARQGLNPGECSWLDRAMAPSDPTSFCDYISHVVIGTTHVQDAQYRPPDIYLLQAFWSRSAPYLEHVRQANYKFTLHVKPDPQCLTVVQTTIPGR